MSGYTLMIDTLCQGIVPTWWECDTNVPVIVATREEAQADIDETIAEFAAQIAAGEREPEDTDLGEWIEAATLHDDGSLVTESRTFTKAELEALR